MLQNAPEVGERLTISGTAELVRARRAVTRSAEEVLGSPRIPDVELCISELVTNALEHGTDPEVELRWEAEGDSFVITVSNSSGRLPQATVGVLPNERATGRGLRIVKMVADGVATRHENGAVVVTCRFDG